MWGGGGHVGWGWGMPESYGATKQDDSVRLWLSAVS